MIRLHRIAACCLLCVAVPVLAQQTAPPTADAATAKSLTKLRTEVQKAKKRFFSLYNRLNEEEAYNVSCNSSAATGTRLAKTTCKTREETDAAEQQSSELVYAMLDAQIFSEQSARDSGRGSNGVTTDSATADATQAQISAGQADAAAAKADALSRKSAVTTPNAKFQEHVLELVNRYPELRKLYDDHAAAVQRYEAALKGG